MTERLEHMTEKLEPMAISVPEAAQLLGVTPPTLNRFVHRDDFPSFRLGGRVLVSVEGLREWVKNQANTTSGG